MIGERTFSDRLPEDFLWEGRKLIYKGKDLSKFYFYPIRVYVDEESQKKIYIIKVINSKEMYNMEITDDDIENLSKIFKGEIFFPEARNVDKIFAFLLITMAENMKEHPLKYIDKMGWNKIGDEVVYVVGNEIISKNEQIKDNIQIKLSENVIYKALLGYYGGKDKIAKLDDEFQKILNNRTDKNAFLFAIKVFRFAGATSLICFGNFIVGLLYTLFEKAGCEPSFVVSVIGKQQTMKTTIAKLCCCKFNTENKNLIGFSSSLSAIKDFISDRNLKDMLAIIDDAHACLSTKEKRDLEIKLSEIIRFSANNIEETKKIGNENIKRSNKCTITITGEQLQDVSSILSRCIIVLHKVAPDKYKLSKLQENQEQLNHFVVDFLKWISDNFCTIVDFIHNEFIRLREIRRNKEYNNERIFDNYNIFNIAFTIFLAYGAKKHYITEEQEKDLMCEIIKTLDVNKKR